MFRGTPEAIETLGESEKRKALKEKLDALKSRKEDRKLGSKKRSSLKGRIGPNQGMAWTDEFQWAKGHSYRISRKESTEVLAARNETSGGDKSRS